MKGKCVTLDFDGVIMALVDDNYLFGNGEYF